MLERRPQRGRRGDYKRYQGKRRPDKKEMKTEERRLHFGIENTSRLHPENLLDQELQTSDKLNALPLASMVLQYQMTVQRQVLLFNELKGRGKKGLWCSIKGKIWIILKQCDSKEPT